MARAVAFVGGGVGDPTGADVSRDVKEIRFECPGDDAGEDQDVGACLVSCEGRGKGA